MSESAVPVSREIADWLLKLMKRRLAGWEEQRRRGFMAMDGIEQRDRRWIEELEMALKGSGPA